MSAIKGSWLTPRQAGMYRTNAGGEVSVRGILAMSIRTLYVSKKP